MFDTKIRRHHQKASEVYIPVKFIYGNDQYDWDIPIEYRRTGTHLLEQNEEGIKEYLLTVYEDCNPRNWDRWRSEQTLFWESKPNAGTTKAFYDVLSSNFRWMSVESDLPKNPNWARRIQDIKEFGYTLATDTSRFDKKLNAKCTHILLLPIARGGLSGYEAWTKEVRDKIIDTLAQYDSFEAKVVRREGILPDHKFPEIRWNEDTKRGDLSKLTSAEIRHDFQLLNNQRNQQKREVCRNCYQSNIRGTIYGIDFYYEGNKNWDSAIPRKGKAAEEGCQGCGWYDIEAWRAALSKKLKAN